MHQALPCIFKKSPTRVEKNRQGQNTLDDRRSFHHPQNEHWDREDCAPDQAAPEIPSFSRLGYFLGLAWNVIADFLYGCDQILDSSLSRIVGHRSDFSCEVDACLFHTRRACELPLDSARACVRTSIPRSATQLLPALFMFGRFFMFGSRDTRFVRQLRSIDRSERENRRSRLWPSLSRDQRARSRLLRLSKASARCSERNRRKSYLLP